MFNRLETLRGLQHGLLTVVNRETGQLVAEVSGCNPIAEKARVVGPVGSGLIGGAVATRSGHVVRDIAKLAPDSLTPWEKSWLTGAPSSAALLIAPIQHGAETVGALSFLRATALDATLESDLRLLTLVAGQVGLAVRFRQIAQERLDTLRAENARLQAQIKNSLIPEGMIGKSSAMRMVYFHVDQVADSKTTVLIRGETGVGKERIAQALWQGGARKNKPFVRVNCAALPESIIESELFGHEKGAFTGALALRKGRFELAHTGTLFLDEFGEISLSTQAKLLRVLQEGIFERVGGTQPIKVDVRLITATNRNLEEMTEQGKFRLDLYYRINVFPIYIPPLRERRSDLLELADYFLEKYCLQNRKRVARISTPAIDMLMAYHWPGNVRELENIIERAVLLTQDGVIHGFHLPPTLQTGEASNTAPRQTLQAALDSVEKEMLVEALKCHRGIMAKAARQLGLTERTIGLRVKAHDIDPRRFRDSDAAE
jgi:Nif-specific regulatory protein